MTWHMRTGADANSNDPYLPKTTLEKAGCPDPDLVFASIISLKAWEPYPTGGNGSGAVTTPIAVDTEPTLEVPNTPEEGGGGLDEDGMLIDFTTGAALVMDSVGTTDFDGDVNALLTYTAPSPKMVWGSDGVMRTYQHNLLLQSQTFENASWARNASYIATNITTAPDGTATADRYYSDAHGASFGLGHLQQQATSTVALHTATVYVKANGWPFLVVSFYDNSAHHPSWFNLNTHTWGTIAAGITTGVQDVGNGWYRISLTYNTAEANAYLIFLLVDADNTLAGADATATGVYLWGAQLERNASASAYLPTTTAARYGIPLDHDPVTHEPLGVLIEEQRTNLVLQSGTLATQSVTVTAAAHTISFWGTGTVTLSGAFVGARAGTGAANRVSLTFTSAAGSLTLTVTGTVSNAQLEAGAFPTSYIPTVASQVTRATDNISLATSAFPYNVPAGTLIVVSDGPVSGGSPAAAAALTDDAAGAESITFFDSFIDIWDDNVNQAGFDLGQPAPGNFRIAAAWALNDFAAVNHANTVLTDNLGTTPSPLKLIFGGAYDGVLSSNSLRGGHVKRLKYLPRRATNAELQGMSS